MSDYTERLAKIAERKQKLLEEETTLKEQRKKYVMSLVEKHHLLSISDDVLEGLFYNAHEEIRQGSEKAKEWQALGKKFRLPAAKPHVRYRRLRVIKAIVIRLDRQVVRMRFQLRKQDTRRKIQLGGLIVKAGLQEEKTAVLLGLLLEAAEKLESLKSEQVREAWRLKGDIVFTQEQKV